MKNIISPPVRVAVRRLLQRTPIYIHTIHIAEQALLAPMPDKLTTAFQSRSEPWIYVIGYAARHFGLACIDTPSLAPAVIAILIEWWSRIKERKEEGRLQRQDAGDFPKEELTDVFSLPPKE